jgi:pimeloyl-ACP methyl ester carboxylesterase
MESTNVRFTILSTALRAVALVAPTWAARWIEAIFLRVRRHPVPRAETRWLAGSRGDTVTSNGVPLAVRIWEGDGPTVGLVHGWEGRGSQLGAFVAPLRELGFRVVAFDSPGHGASPGKRSSLLEIADAVVDVERATGPWHGVVAHSAGAAATSWALRQGLASRRLVFIAPPTDLEVFFYRVVDHLRIPRPLAEMAQRRIEERLGVRWRDFRHQALAPLQTEDLLLIHDRDDREVPLRGAREIHRLWRGSRLLETRGLGHRRILRDGAVVEAAVGFLASGAAAVVAEPGEVARRAS